MKRFCQNAGCRRILFVCHGNICRSPMAEFVMKELLCRTGRDDIEVDSAALHTDEIGNDIHRGTRAKLREMGIPFTPRAAWLLTPAKAREYDFLIGMDDYNIADLRRLVFPEDAGKIRKLMSFAGTERPIADPWYTGDFDATDDNSTHVLPDMKRTVLLALAFYAAFLLGIAVWRPWATPAAPFSGHWQLVPFTGTAALWRSGIVPFTFFFIGNIACFVPFGFGLPALTRLRRSVIPLCFLGSLLIENLQWTFGTGAPQVEDLILNTLGGVLGYLLFRFPAASAGRFH